MSRSISLIFLFCINVVSCHSQAPVDAPKYMKEAATRFLQTLSDKQKKAVQFSFADEERYNWHFVPKSRKGIPLKEMNAAQRKATLDLLRTALSDTGYEKTTAIVRLEDILREAEGRPGGDDYRDDGKYYLTIFGEPSTDAIWGWRFEGHHISLNFSSENNKLASGTPGFLGTNPATVLSGPDKGKQILKDETEIAFALLQSLDESQKKKAVIGARAPSDIITGNDRDAMIDDPKGILYGELNSTQQKLFIQLLSVYIHRYTKFLATAMMRDIEDAGLNKLRFAWAGDQQVGVGHPRYYRIHGPTIIIEYDNTQNNANHVHTVVRDLKNDFGGDVLMEHYRKNKH